MRAARINNKYVFSLALAAGLVVGGGSSAFAYTQWEAYNASFCRVDNSGDWSGTAIFQASGNYGQMTNTGTSIAVLHCPVRSDTAIYLGSSSITVNVFGYNNGNSNGLTASTIISYTSSNGGASSSAASGSTNSDVDLTPSLSAWSGGGDRAGYELQVLMKGVDSSSVQNVIYNYDVTM
jgi:hypothetical protein